MINNWNSGAANWASQQAQQNADNAYRNALLAGESEDRALNAAKFEWQKTMDQAGLTGQYQGQWTMPTQQYFANTFGTWGAPTAGQQTSAQQQQDWQQAFNQSMAYGSYIAPGSTPQAGQQTQAAQNQAFQQAQALAAMYGTAFAPGGAGPAAGQQTQAAQQQAWQQGMTEQEFAEKQRQNQQANAQNYLQLLSTLRGPADWAKYQQVLGATPGGMRDLAAAAMGQYIPGGGATTGMQPQAANLTTMLQQIQGQPVTWTGQGSVPQGQLTMPGQYGGAANPTFQTMGPETARQQYYQQQMLAGGASPAMQQATGQATPQTNEQAMQQGMNAYNQARQQVAGGGMGGQPSGQDQIGQLPAPNQIAPQAWKSMAPSQQQLLLGQYESQGWDKGDVQALYDQSLPKYGSNAPTAGTFRLR